MTKALSELRKGFWARMSPADREAFVKRCQEGRVRGRQERAKLREAFEKVVSRETS